MCGDYIMKLREIVLLASIAFSSGAIAKEVQLETITDKYQGHDIKSFEQGVKFHTPNMITWYSGGVNNSVVVSQQQNFKGKLCNRVIVTRGNDFSSLLSCKDVYSKYELIQQ
jgi:hypothetical protein